MNQFRTMAPRKYMRDLGGATAAVEKWEQFGNSVTLNHGRIVVSN